MDGKVIVVTGAGSGIGRAAALGLAAEGHRLVLAGRRADALQETAALIGADAGRVLCCATDVTDPAAVEALFAEAVRTFGRVDVVFNNAGVFDNGPVEEITPERWTRSVDINVTGAFYCAQAAFRQMKAQAPQGGRIINNGSVSSQVPRPNAVSYTVSKHAITGLTRALALEGRGCDIACGQIDIGNAATDMTDTISKGVLQADGSLRAEATMDISNVVKALVYMVGLPLDANVPFMTVAATRMPLMGRG